MKLRATALVLGAVLIVPAFAQNTSTIHSRSNLSVASSANMEHIPPHRLGLNGNDRRFMMDVAGANRSEMMLGKLAEQNGGEWAQGFGKDMQREHGIALEELKKVAMDKGISLPGDVPMKAKRMYAMLSRLHGSAFDRAYRSMMIDDHRTDLGKVQDEIRMGRDADVKSYAVKLETAVKLHLKMAQQQTTMMGTSGG